MGGPNLTARLQMIIQPIILIDPSNWTEHILKQDSCHSQAAVLVDIKHVHVH